MAQADTNELNPSGSSQTTPTTSPAPAQSKVRILADDATASESSAEQTVAESGDEKPKFYVDGEPVSEEDWLKAAGENGYNVNFLRSHPNYRPSISTKEHEPPK